MTKGEGKKSPAKEKKKKTKESVTDETKEKPEVRRTAVEAAEKSKDSATEDAKAPSPGPGLVKPTPKNAEPTGGSMYPPYPPYQQFLSYPPPPGYYPLPHSNEDGANGPPPNGMTPPWHHPSTLYPPPPYGGYPPYHLHMPPASPYMPPPYSYGDPNSAPLPPYDSRMPPVPANWPPSGHFSYNVGPYSQETAPKPFQGSFTFGEPSKNAGAAAADEEGPDQDATGDESLPDDPKPTESLGFFKNPKQKLPSKQQILHRRARKNDQSRARAAKHRETIALIEAKNENDRTPEEKELLALHNARREKKNNRSRSRAIEMKEEIYRILNKPEAQRTDTENAFLSEKLDSKQRKNMGDRNRRKRIKVAKQRVGDHLQDMCQRSFEEIKGEVQRNAQQEMLHPEQRGQSPTWPPAHVAL